MCTEKWAAEIETCQTQCFVSGLTCLNLVVRFTPFPTSALNQNDTDRQFLFTDKTNESLCWWVPVLDAEVHVRSNPKCMKNNNKYDRTVRK